MNNLDVLGLMRMNKATARRHGRFGYLEIVHASDMLNDAVAAVVPDVHAKGEVA